ncbi:regulator of chromosome condensation RCC1 [Besnoitia besnoiti]|uniref:Regulator of chromosome condensation RCC1 n=1 Tax=Besnoitia besnoiti TaxID=94643 RepID=A0A2A9MG93_BESBE|nr:regulator of chromosome condensation RCC1 [Besnoitia besnoiti]PFH34673.1 regulator of chromosome condensation RCC1 [Besnoitia besnoiti]
MESLPPSQSNAVAPAPLGREECARAEADAAMEASVVPAAGVAALAGSPPKGDAEAAGDIFGQERKGEEGDTQQTQGSQQAPQNSTASAATDEEWRCPICLVVNAPTDLTCPCCEGPKPGHQPSSGRPSSGPSPFATGTAKGSGFHLVGSVSAAPSSSGGFVFGASAAPEGRRSEGFRPDFSTASGAAASSSVFCTSAGSSSTPFAAAPGGSGSSLGASASQSANAGAEVKKRPSGFVPVLAPSESQSSASAASEAAAAADGRAGVCVPAAGAEEDAEEKEEEKERLAVAPKAPQEDAAEGVPTATVFMFGSGEMDQMPFWVQADGEDDEDREVVKPRAVVEFNGKHVIRAASGAMHSAVLTADGRCWTFGCSDGGVLGRGAHLGNKALVPDAVPIAGAVVEVACGDSHTAFLTRQGRLYLAGTYRDAYGALGFPDFAGAFRGETPAFVAENAMPALVFSGLNRPRISAVACGENHTVALEHGGGAFYVWGSNEFGQLGVSSASSLASAAQASEKNGDTATLLAGGGGEVALQAKLSLLLPARRTVGDLVGSLGLPSGLEIKRLFCGKCTTFMTLEASAAEPNGDAGEKAAGASRGEREGTSFVLGCGRNSQGEVGCGVKNFGSIVDKFVQVKKLDGEAIKFIGGGQFFSVALRADGALYTWGQSDFTGAKQANAQAAAVHDFALGAWVCGSEATTGEKLTRMTAGAASSGALFRAGLGAAFGKYTSVEEPTPLNKFAAPLRWVQCGSDHCLAVTTSGILYTWGAGQNFQLGNGEDVEIRRTPFLVDPRLFDSTFVLQAFGGSQHSMVLSWTGAYAQREAAKEEEEGEDEGTSAARKRHRPDTDQEEEVESERESKRSRGYRAREGHRGGEKKSGESKKKGGDAGRGEGEGEDEGEKKEKGEVAGETKAESEEEETRAVEEEEAEEQTKRDSAKGGAAEELKEEEDEEQDVVVDLVVDEETGAGAKKALKKSASRAGSASRGAGGGRGAAARTPSSRGGRAAAPPAKGRKASEETETSRAGTRAAKQTTAAKVGAHKGQEPEPKAGKGAKQAGAKQAGAKPPSRRGTPAASAAKTDEKTRAAAAATGGRSKGSTCAASRAASRASAGKKKEETKTRVSARGGGLSATPKPEAKGVPKRGQPARGGKSAAKAQEAKSGRRSAPAKASGGKATPARGRAAAEKKQAPVAVKKTIDKKAISRRGTPSPKKAAAKFDAKRRPSSR